MKTKVYLVITLIIMLIFTFAVAAASIVSPALNVIARKNTMIKSGLVYSDVYFSEHDFKKCLGLSNVEKIKVEELPEATDGVLKLGSLSVTKGQTISSEYISSLRFVPSSDSVYSAEVVFSYDGTAIPCTIKILDEINYAPAFASESSAARTYSNVSCYGSVKFSDPDGDITDLQVVVYPEHGTLSITDPLRGGYKYTPANGYSGDDEFVVVARDSYGNYSSVQTVSVDVEKNKVSFVDTAGHWCENAAICLYKMGATEVADYKEGLVFCPEDNITREEFVVTAMKALGITTLTDSNTSFADNLNINVEYRPYIATAQRMGYISGKEIEGAKCFDPKGNITKAEAAVVINNIVDMEEAEYITTFADDNAIPVWAKSAVYALTSAGVFNGDGEGVIAPSALLSRAETVQMLYNIIVK